MFAHGPWWRVPTREGVREQRGILVVSVFIGPEIFTNIADIIIMIRVVLLLFSVDQLSALSNARSAAPALHSVIANDARTCMDYQPLPRYLTIGRSSIHGLGLFATAHIESGTDLGQSHVLVAGELIRTPLGGFYNHVDSNPNIEGKRQALSLGVWLRSGQSTLVKSL